MCIALQLCDKRCTLGGPIVVPNLIVGTGRGVIDRFNEAVSKLRLYQRSIVAIKGYSNHSPEEKTPR